MQKYLFLLILGCLYGFTIFSCEKEIEEERIQLPSTPVLSIRSNWGVVTSHFLRVREEPFQKAKILAHLRKRSVLEILSRTQKRESVENESSYWYQINYEGLRGWVFGAYIEILESKARAESFANGL